MSLEGLQTILTKEEIVQTQRAADLVDRPEMVERAYNAHVRSYIPFGREAEGNDKAQSVTAFEKQVIKAVKNASAVRGYITAEYGHGKTSTMLYLWKRAREDNLLAVPPFVLTQLADFVTATYGWLRYEITRTHPDANLISEIDTLYETVANRSADTLAEQYGIDRTSAQQLIKDRPELLSMNTANYLSFFEKATDLAQQAGFDGLLVLADEVQQYIDPEVKTGVKDPISPLFDLISGLITRRNHLNMGLLMVLPPKELDVLRDQRGDLIHRLEARLDLRTVYNRDFPVRLWQRLAEQFEFEEHSHRIVQLETLNALGQIGARADLSDGPRTVVNTFRRMTRRYLDLQNPPDDPYTPEHLINDLLNGRITFNTSQKIPQTVNQAMGHSLVKGYADRERAIKWAAAFPEEGVSRELQEKLGLSKAFDDLLSSAQGDLVISVGDVKTPGVTLRGLDRVELNKDALSILIRQFWRVYDEQQHKTYRRTINAFFKLLTAKVFPSGQWSVEESRPEELLTRNRGLLLKGAFNTYSRTFPERRLLIRLLWEDEPVKDTSVEADLVIQFNLKTYLDKMEADRREYHLPLEINYENKHIFITMNLMCLDETSIALNIQKTVGNIVSPYKFTPMLMLALYEFLEEERAANKIPKKDDQHIQYMFQPELLDNIFRLLFNAVVGSPVNSAQERILEEATKLLLEASYPDYHTIMNVGNWSSSLVKYRNALKHLETSHERQGQMVVEGTKEDIAELFTSSNTGLDTFISNYQHLIEIRQPFPSQKEAREGKKAQILFQLHPLERQIKNWLAQSTQTQQISISQQLHTIKTLPTNEIYHRAKNAGYHDREVDEILALMEERNLLVKDQRGFTREEINQAPSLDELDAEIALWQSDIATLLKVFQQNQLKTWQEDAQKFTQNIGRLRQKPDDQQAVMARRSVQRYRRDLEDFVKDRHHDLKNQIVRFEKSLHQPSPQHLRTLSQPIQGGVNYIEQVNDVRSRLFRQVSGLKSETDMHRQQVESVAKALQTDNLSIEALVQQADKFKTLQDKNPSFDDKCQEREKDFNHFADWIRLVQDGSNLADQLQELGEAVQEQKQKFHKLSQTITGELSARKLDALPDAPTYAMQLQRIYEETRRIKTEASNRFTALQDRYRQALTNRLKYPADQLWVPFSYNPSDPEDSYHRLRQEVKKVLLASHQRLQKSLGDQRQEVEVALRSPYLKEHYQEMKTTGQTLLTNFTEFSNQLDILHSALQSEETIRDFPQDGESAFLRLLDSLTSIIDRFRDMRKEVTRLSDVVRKSELTGPEKSVAQLLSVSGSTELTELQKKTSLPDDEWWPVLRGLYAKGRIRIFIEPIKYDD